MAPISSILHRGHAGEEVVTTGRRDSCNQNRVKPSIVRDTRGVPFFLSPDSAGKAPCTRRQQSHAGRTIRPNLFEEERSIEKAKERKLLVADVVRFPVPVRRVLSSGKKVMSAFRPRNEVRANRVETTRAGAPPPSLFSSAVSLKRLMEAGGLSARDNWQSGFGPSSGRGCRFGSDKIGLRDG